MFWIACTIADKIDSQTMRNTYTLYTWTLLHLPNFLCFHGFQWLSNWCRTANDPALLSAYNQGRPILLAGYQLLATSFTQSSAALHEFMSGQSHTKFTQPNVTYNNYLLHLSNTCRTPASFSLLAPAPAPAALAPAPTPYLPDHIPLTSLSSLCLPLTTRPHLLLPIPSLCQCCLHIQARTKLPPQCQDFPHRRTRRPGTPI